MSRSNFTFEAYFNLTSNLTSNYSYEETSCYTLAKKIYRSSVYLDFIYDAIGIPLNTWILVAILTSTDLRARMRNKMLAGICVQGLFDCIVLLPLVILNYSDPANYFSSCHTHRAHGAIFYFSEFVSNWNLVTVLALVVFTLYGSSVTLGGWNRALTQAVTYGVLLWPWLFSAITVIPTILNNYSEYVYNIYGALYCFSSLASGARRALYAINIGVPACVAAALVAAMIFLNRKRARAVSSGGDISRQLIGGESESEPIRPYIAIVAIIFVCDFGVLMRFVYIQLYSMNSANYCAIIVLRVTAELLEGARDILLPLVFLLFPEVRCQAKKLLLMARPGRRADDVTVAYVKDV